MKTLSKYITADGREFVDLEEAQKHEDSIMNDFIFAYDIFGRKLNLDLSNPNVRFVFVDPAILDTFKRYFKKEYEFKQGGLYYRDPGQFWIYLSDVTVNTIKNLDCYE